VATALTPGGGYIRIGSAGVPGKDGGTTVHVATTNHHHRLNTNSFSEIFPLPSKGNENHSSCGEEKQANLQ